ncbi:MAG TPA: hypothetical protein VFO65_11825 [Acidimicrobiales bacterium]|nr:hypothetical protein [Acidimicrobiales bacterium]
MSTDQDQDQAQEPTQDRLDTLQEDIDQARTRAAELNVEEDPKFIQSGDESGHRSGDEDDRPVDDTIAPPG